MNSSSFLLLVRHLLLLAWHLSLVASCKNEFQQWPPTYKFHATCAESRTSRRTTHQEQAPLPARNWLTQGLCVKPLRITLDSVRCNCVRCTVSCDNHANGVCNVFAADLMKSPIPSNHSHDSCSVESSNGWRL